MLAEINVAAMRVVVAMSFFIFNPFNNFSLWFMALLPMPIVTPDRSCFFQRIGIIFFVNLLELFGVLNDIDVNG